MMMRKAIRCFRVNRREIGPMWGAAISRVVACGTMPIVAAERSREAQRQRNMGAGSTNFLNTYQSTL